MKTEQEQIDEMIKIFTDNREVCHHMRCVECKYHGDKECMYSSYAYSLYQAGYGDISEYKAEIERVKSNNGFLQCVISHSKDIMDEAVKQAQIDVLNKLKTRHDYAIKNMGYPWDISQQIDELIKEIEDDK